MVRVGVPTDTSPGCAKWTGDTDVAPLTPEPCGRHTLGVTTGREPDLKGVLKALLLAGSLAAEAARTLRGRPAGLAWEADPPPMELGTGGLVVTDVRGRVAGLGVETRPSWAGRL